MHYVENRHTVLPVTIRSSINDKIQENFLTNCGTLKKKKVKKGSLEKKMPAFQNCYLQTKSRKEACTLFILPASACFLLLELPKTESVRDPSDFAMHFLLIFFKISQVSLADI